LYHSLFSSFILHFAYVALFFFLLFGSYRYLPSFPTRRSSDLSAARCGCGRRTTWPRRRPTCSGPTTWRSASRTPEVPARRRPPRDRKSTRLNSSHVKISYAVFCLKKKKKKNKTRTTETRYKK